MRIAMSALFDCVSRKATRRVRTLLIFIAITFALFNPLGPTTRGVAPPSCCTEVPLFHFAVTSLPSAECDVAMTKAGNGALQGVVNQRNANGCPQECPFPVWVTPPHITIPPKCTLVMIDGFVRWHASAGAEGTYMCIP